MVRAPVNIDKVPAGPELNALVAERVMGWKELKRQSDRYWGTRKDRAGRWRRAAVQDYLRAPAMALSTVFLVTIFGLVWLQRMLLGDRQYTTISGKGYSPRRVDLGIWKWLVFAFCILDYIETGRFEKAFVVGLILTGIVILVALLARVFGMGF